jgi:hypothetical protein
MLRKNKEAIIENVITKESFKVKVRNIPPLLKNIPPKAIKVGIPAKIGIKKVIRNEKEKKRTCLIFLKYATNVAWITFGMIIVC